MPKIEAPDFYGIMKRIICFEVDEKYARRPVKDILKNKYKMSSALVTSLKKTEYGIMVNGEKKFTNYMLEKGDILKVVIEEGASENIEPSYAKIDVLYEDEDILAVNKPYNMPTHTSAGHHFGTLSNAVLYYLNQNGEKHTFHAVTRLDKNTSGVVLIAKNRYAHDLLSNLLRRGVLQKIYSAIVLGELSGSGLIEGKIRREDESIIKRVVADDGQEALTEYFAVSSNKSYSYVRLIPKTGRTHQIRVHMSYIGHPLAGDVLYGGNDVAKRHLLHCESLIFIHPMTNKKIEIKAPMPEDFLEFSKQQDLRLLQ